MKNSRKMTVLSQAAMAGASYAEKILAMAPIAFWRMNEASGTAAVCSVDSAQNGTYARDLSVMGTEDGPVTGEVAPTFDGSNDYLDLYTTTFREAFEAAVEADGSISFWVKLPSAVWTDGTARQFFLFRDDANNWVSSARHTNNNYLRHQYRAGGTSETVDASGQSDTGWVNWIFTWSVSSDEFKVYKNGVQIGTTQTGLGTWDGPVSALYTLIGASYKSPISAPLSGSISNFAVFDKVLSSGEIAVCTNP